MMKPSCWFHKEAVGESSLDDLDIKEQKKKLFGHLMGSKVSRRSEKIMINKQKLLINQILKVIYEYTSYFTFFILEKTNTFT